MRRERATVTILVIWFIFNYIMSYTATGRHIYAIGSNVDAARLSGVEAETALQQATEKFITRFTAMENAILI